MNDKTMIINNDYKTDINNVNHNDNSNGVITKKQIILWSSHWLTVSLSSSSSVVTITVFVNEER